MNDQDKNKIIAPLVNLAAAVGLSKTTPYFTERRFLDEENISFSVQPAVSKGIVWGQLVKVGKPIEKDPKFFLAALQKILHSCSAPSSKLLFLIVGGGNQENGVFVGIDSLSADLNALAKFVSSVWPGTLLVQKEIQNSVLLKKLSQDLNESEKKEDILDEFGAVTGIPSMDSYDTIYPSTIDHLIEGMSTCRKYAYLVVAEPVENKMIDDMIYQCREIQGQAESLKNIQVAESITNSLLANINKGQNEQYKTAEIGAEALLKIAPKLVKNKESAKKIMGGALGMIPFLNGSAVHNMSVNTSEQIGASTAEGCTISKNIVNKQVEAISNHLQKYAERFELGKAIGMWNVKTFLMTKNKNDYNKGEMLLKSILSGQESKYEPIRITNVSDTLNKDKDKKKELCKFNFPSLEVKIKEESQGESQKGSRGVSIEHPFGELYEYLSSIITTKELTSFINLPLKSVPGIIVKEQATFGRNIISSTKVETPIRLGDILHLGECDENNHVELDINALSSHTFITGTTGSGKSNTVYLMLKQLKEHGINFLVIEPAKGEYKHVFGNKPGVSVYGSNPNMNQLLRINPFEFPEGVHVYEHIDRLVEIFNACWPMYAAMPVVLKKAITDAYKQCGWNLHSSIQEINSTRKLFPTVNDVVVALRDFINNSEYSAETKSDYKGSLETRLISMSEGLTGMMLNNTKGNISNSDLFQKNVIVDLSRVGNTETKALIMGLLIMKMNEFYQTQGKMNSSLNHITVLEEAHNLLKRTSTAQSQESSNLAGKSVEMICNSIAEMRTYGEGFIIVDQSPSQLDLAAIRNTNTKIILSLPEADDRECAGKSIGLKDEQINEIGRLKMGEAIVYQNDWEEPVQCKVNEFKYNKEERYKGHKDSYNVLDESHMLYEVLSFLYMYCGGSNDTVKQIDDLRCSIFDCKLLSATKFSLLKLIDDYNKNGVDLNKRNHVKVMKIVGACLGLSPQIKKIIMKKRNIAEANDSIKDLIINLLPNGREGFYRFCTRCSLRLLASESSTNIDFYNKWFRTYYK